jgi:meso-butanediol dehydrogenase/(S,S)-butanediol dehydrogenase/diacetyl reductase
MTERLDGHRAVVTGAAKGIGEAIARRYGAEGASVALLDIDTDGMEEVAADIDAETVTVECDVADTDSVEAAIDEVVEGFGGIDILVNNAGIVHREPLTETSDDEIDAVIDINLKGVLKVTRAATPALRDSGGCIINMSSITAKEGTLNRSVYSATKGGVSALTFQQSLELAPDVRVNAIAPGTIKTPLSEEARQDPDYMERKLSVVPQDRLGEPEDIAGAAVYLATADADYVNGHVLAVDGARYHT